MTSGSKILAAGIQQPSELESSVRSIVAGLDELDEDPTPAAAVAVAAEHLARRADSSLRHAGFRLLDHQAPTKVTAIVEERLTEISLDLANAPYLLGRLYEQLLSPVDRQRTSAHLTSATVAQGLVDCVSFDVARSPGVVQVLDPAVGGAAFLLAAASRQLLEGHDPDAVFDGLHGVDIDGGAVAVAEAALGLWLIQQDCAPRPNAQIRVGDGLVDRLPQVDVVVGNPPFRNQLQRDSARSSERRHQLKDRWGELAGAYTDDAWLFVAAGLQALSAGSLAMIQPLSILSARHAESLRRMVADEHALVGLWVPFAKVFDAAVDVCGVVLRAATPSTQPVKRWFGTEFETRDDVAPESGESVVWGPLAAQMQGVPMTALATANATSLSDLAGATAGFRRQFYGLKPHVGERLAGSSNGSSDDSPWSSRLVTVGMIDPMSLQWGRREFTFAGDRYREPVIDLLSLEREDPALMAWIAARQRPKLLVATQTRIVEAWVDIEGTAVPATPVISVEPHNADDIWLLAALLNAPVISAHLAGQSFGTALSINAIKFSAQELGSLPLPSQRSAWNDAAELLAEHTIGLPDHDGAFSVDGVPRAFATLMQRAYGVSADASDWWQRRLEPVLDRYR